MGKQEEKQARYRARQRQSDPFFKKYKEELSEEKVAEGEDSRSRRKQIERIREAHSRIQKSWRQRKS